MGKTYWLSILRTTAVISPYVCVICTNSRSHLCITHIYSIKFLNRVTSIIKHTPIHSEIDTKFHPRTLISMLLLEPNSPFLRTSFQLITAQIEINFNRIVTLFTKIWLHCFKNEPVNDLYDTTNHSGKWQDARKASRLFLQRRRMFTLLPFGTYLRIHNLYHCPEQHHMTTVRILGSWAHPYLQLTLHSRTTTTTYQRPLHWNPFLPLFRRVVVAAA